jgi:nucleotide-binding universal stress UspA family protein
MRLLVATDGSTEAERAVALVGAIAWPAMTEARVVAVVEDVPDWLMLPAEGVPVVDPQLVEQQAASELSAALDRAAAVLRTASLVVDPVLRRGRPSTWIGEEARTFGADLVVLGSRGRGPFSTMLLGSVSAEVVDQVEAPVLVARSTSLGPVIIAADGSDGARHAVDLLLACRALVPDVARVVSVAHTPPLAMFAMEPVTAEAATIWADTREAMVASATRVATLTANRLRQAGLTVEVATPEGDPAHELVREARERDARLIAMGSRGQTGLTRFVLGSVARNVLVHATCSVLIVKEPRPS